MRAYPYDVRLCILHAVDQRKSRAEIINIFDVSRATLKRYLKLRHENGDVKPKAVPGRPAKKEAALLAGLQPQLDAYPDATHTGEKIRQAIVHQEMPALVSPAPLTRLVAN